VAGFLAAYAFARIPVPGGDLLLWALVLSMALPEIVTVIPLYQLLRNMGLIDSVLGLSLVMCSVLAPFSVWVLVGFIQQIPRDIEDAATIDGASLLQVVWFVALPLVAPVLATVAVINFVNAWNNLLYRLAFSASPEAKTLSVAVTEIFQARAPWGRPWNLVSTLGLTMVAPIILLVFASQRAIVQGLTRGAVK
jgi:ABC-type glycerol-3-phosphate transport system permease component